ncbi:MAG TPA: ATP-binding protein, partial [Candidatus Polarisedimenticolia bacterium]|nr:ATP-binding protein [Candidatus Polarisedimenticolia bacterium]
PPVPADPNQMQQVLVNLLLNAADAIGEAGGAIRVSTRRGGRERPAVELVVEDDGRGIPPEAMAHLFEPFFTTKGTRGTGLGLAITWGIVQAHGGTIEVHSEVGRGSRFTVLLPLKEADSAPVAAA